MKIILSRPRIFALIKKEFLQIKRDRSALLIAFILPIFLTLVFGYAISIDTNKIRIAIVNESAQSSKVGELINFFNHSKFVDVKLITTNREKAQEKILSQEIGAILTIPADFNIKLEKEKIAEVFLATDGSDPNTASFCGNYVREILNLYSNYLNTKKGIKIAPQINIETRFWYNEALKADHLLNIGSLGFVLSIVGTLLTALVVAREWERGSMEYLVASPVLKYEIILGKIIPYIALGMGSFLVTFLSIIILFAPPFKGSLLIFFFIGFIYLIVTTGLGLLISSAAKSQFVASQGAILISMVPTIMLSGLIYDIETMPKIMQIIATIVPAKYLISATRTIFMVGNEWQILIPNILGILALIGLIYFGISRKVKKSID